MTARPSRHVLVLSVIAIAAVIGATVPWSTLRAQEDTGAHIVVGTYQPQQVAQDLGLQQMMMQKLQGLQQRMQTAQQQGNREEMQRIQSEAQQIQQEAVNDFQTKMDDAMPAVAKAAGVDIIAVGVAYTAPGIETKDVTGEVVAQVKSSMEQPEATVPQEQ